MNLSKRASLLILPVILISYALAALGIYDNLRQSVMSNEQSRLEYRLSGLQSTFSLYSTFVDAYMVSLIEGNVLGEFIYDANNIYRERILNNNLESAIHRFRSQNPEFVSLSIINKFGEVLYYSENSTDPFGMIQPAQQAMAKSLFELGKLDDWQHLMLGKVESIIQQGQSIDTRTMAPPLPTQLENTVQVIIAAKPTRFDQLLAGIEKDYGASGHFSFTSPHFRGSELSASIALKPGYFFSIDANKGYVANLLASLKKWLGLSIIFASVLTFLVLQLLIRRYVTQPITQLDEQLSDVLEKRRHNIESPTGQDEVARLGRKFHQLYKDLNSAFHQSHKLSQTDTLTQLPNRSAFYDAAVHELSESEKRREPISFIYIDLDNFKFVNDKYGHEVGDELLKAVALRLSHLLDIALHQQASSPFISRLSGDEFIVMLPEMDAAAASEIGEKILHIFAKGYHFELGSFPVTASLGLSCYPEDGHTLSQLISNADLAMYEAKKSGKNKLARYSKTLAKEARRGKEIEANLKHLNPDNEFYLVYMPIISNSGTISGCEALLRWHSPHLGIVGPDEFIPIAESTGLFEEIDFWVIEQAHQHFETLQQALGQEIKLAINISSAELNNEHFVSKLKAITARFPIETRQIELEITETFAITSDISIQKTLRKLRDAGYQIAIDDFGTGYTSLMQMLDYPVDKIKLDKAFIDRVTQAEKQSLLAPLINLCHLQGLTVTAEGVETPEQQSLLWQAQCDFLQGYLIAKPMPLIELRAWAKGAVATHPSNIPNTIAPRPEKTH